MQLGKNQEQEQQAGAGPIYLFQLLLLLPARAPDLPPDFLWRVRYTSSQYHQTSGEHIDEVDHTRTVCSCSDDSFGLR